MSNKTFSPIDLTNMTACDTPEKAVETLIELYQKEISKIHQRFSVYASGHAMDDAASNGLYPLLSVSVPARQVRQTSMLSMGRIAGETLHATTITRPDLFEAYLLEQLHYVKGRFDVDIYVGLSDVPIPLTFALEAAASELSTNQKEGLQYFFHLPNLAATNDDIVDGRKILQRSGPLPLSLFTAERVDYSLHRIRHYTGTDPQYFQPFILFTNYQRYVSEFIETALEEVKSGKAKLLVEPGNRITGADGCPNCEPIQKMPQMPAYHLVREAGPNGERTGVTLVNIGVGPSNAKNITDHLAVLRPHAWLMIGHCGALRRSQRLGDYVLAHAYLRDDQVLDHVLPPSIPLPNIAEVQVALTEAVLDVTGLDRTELKKHLRTGTVVTTDDRNWELEFENIAARLNQARAIAIDMESATVAANGYRFRVPYGTLLCASDRPIHGEIKLPGMADAFYQERVGQHLEIGMRTVDYLAEQSLKGALHSRKLRSFDEPLFR